MMDKTFIYTVKMG